MVYDYIQTSLITSMELFEANLITALNFVIETVNSTVTDQGLTFQRQIQQAAVQVVISELMKLHLRTETNKHKVKIPSKKKY